MENGPPDISFPARIIGSDCVDFGGDGIIYTIGGLGNNSQKALEIANSLP